MLDEKQPATRLENPAHLAQRRDRVCDRAEGPGHHNRIKDCICKGKLLRRGRQKRYWGARGQPSLARQPQQFERGVNRDYASGPRRVERQIQTRSDPNLKDRPPGRRDRLLPIEGKPVVPHRQVQKARQDQFRVKTHAAEFDGPRHASIAYHVSERTCISGHPGCCRVSHSQMATVRTRSIACKSAIFARISATCSAARLRASARTSSSSVSASCISARTSSRAKPSCRARRTNLKRAMSLAS